MLSAPNNVIPVFQETFSQFVFVGWVCQNEPGPDVLDFETLVLTEEDLWGVPVDRLVAA